MKKIASVVLVAIVGIFFLLYAQTASQGGQRTRGFLDVFLVLFDFPLSALPQKSGITGDGGTSPNLTNVPPSADSCGGTYDLTSPYKNFGDPQCNFDKDQLFTQIEKLDPANAHYWFQIVKCESNYNPNAYLAASTSGKGAYGLFQMNPAGQGNGEYDVGNVIWGLQTSNAINYNKKVIGESFAYWACAP